MHVNQYQKTDNMKFAGNLYSHLGRHVTKPIHCCKHGDWKFINFINEIAMKNSDSFTVNAKGFPKKSIEVKTKEFPELSLREKICFIVTPIQNKAINMRKNGRIDSFTYQLSEKEYQNLKKEARQSIFFSKKLCKTLENFENYLRIKIPDAENAALDKIIY